MVGKVVVADAMIRETCLPDREVRLQSERESSLDELNRSLQRAFRRGCDQRMKVIGHDDKVMEPIFTLRAAVEEHVDEEVGGGDALEFAPAVGGDGRDEKCAIHFPIVAFWR